MVRDAWSFIGLGPPTMESKKRKSDVNVAFFATFCQGHQLFGPPKMSLFLRPWSSGSLISRTGPRWIFAQCRSDRAREGQNTKKKLKSTFFRDTLFITLNVLQGSQLRPWAFGDPSSRAASWFGGGAEPQQCSWFFLSSIFANFSDLYWWLFLWSVKQFFC